MMLKMFANSFWTFLPGQWQKKVSHLFSIFFTLKMSRLILTPYFAMCGLDDLYLEQFRPESDRAEYQSYADFFRRKYKVAPELEALLIWPCEGYLCDWGRFSEKNQTHIKGQTINLSKVFFADQKIPESYFFANIFLHNHNYHRIHSPIEGVIKTVSYIAGDLQFLRPWFYKREDVTFPALRNERVTLEIQDVKGHSWFMTLVGGFGVGTISLEPQLARGSFVQLGQELGHFKLGSTVCLASPLQFEACSYLQKVRYGQALPVKDEWPLSRQDESHPAAINLYS